MGISFLVIIHTFNYDHQRSNDRHETDMSASPYAMVRVSNDQMDITLYLYSLLKLSTAVNDSK